MALPEVCLPQGPCKGKLSFSLWHPEGKRRGKIEVLLKGKAFLPRPAGADATAEAQPGAGETPEAQPGVRAATEAQPVPGETGEGQPKGPQFTWSMFPTVNDAWEAAKKAHGW